MKRPLLVLALLAWAAPLPAQVAIRGELVHTMAGAPIVDGVVVVEDGRIQAVGPAADVVVPDGFRVLQAAVVTPGLIDARTVVGLAGYLNQAHDQDQLDHGAPVQPELRAQDAYNPRERLVGYLRSFGVTTIHAGHAPGQVISGQTLIAKTRGDTVADAVLRECAMVAATIGEGALVEKPATGPGTRAKAVALLRTALVDAAEYAARRNLADVDKRPARDLQKETLARVLAGEIPLLVTAHRHHDLLTALRLREEFGFRLVLDGAADAPEVLAEIQAAGVPVLLHPTMVRPQGETRNASFATASLLAAAGVPFAIQGGYESYVPKARVVLLEAAVAAAHGLSRADALAAITIDAARILGIEDRVGSLEVGKDGDLALFDGDPFEYTAHCVGVVIEGEVVEEGRR